MPLSNQPDRKQNQDELVETLLSPASTHGERRLSAFRLQGTENENILYRLRTECLTHEDPSVRQAAAEALKDTKNVACQLELCQKGISDPDRHVRQASEFSLVNDPSTDALLWLWTHGVTHESESVRTSSIRILYGTKNPIAVETFVVMIEKETDPQLKQVYQKILDTIWELT